MSPQTVLLRTTLTRTITIYRIIIIIIIIIIVSSSSSSSSSSSILNIFLYIYCAEIVMQNIEELALAT